MKETELAKILDNYFISQGYETYKEVPICGGRIDILATDGTIRIGCEVKTTATVKVIEQACNTRAYCHYSYVAVPHVKNKFFQSIVSKYELGLLLANFRGENVFEACKPVFHRRCLKINLKDYQKTNIAGGNEYMTDFKQTVNSIVDYVKKHPGTKFSEVLDNIKFHYHTISTAKSSIRKRINQGIITQFRIEKGIVILNEVQI